MERHSLSCHHFTSGQQWPWRFHKGRWDDSPSGTEGFPASSAGKASTCKAGDPGSIPRLGRSTGEWSAYPLQYSWASLVAQLVKNPPAMQETWVQSLCWEDPLENGKATLSCNLAWRIPWTLVHGVANSQTWLNNFHFTGAEPSGEVLPSCESGPGL